MLEIPLIEEKYGRSVMVSLAVHIAVLVVLVVGAKLFPGTVVLHGSGQGGGISGADIITVGLVDQFSGGTGMIKPSMVPQPPAIVPAPQAAQPKDQPKISEIEVKPLTIPEKIEAPKPKAPETKPETKPDPKPEAKTEPKPEIKPAVKPASKTTAKPKEATPPPGNIIPVEPRPGSGGASGNAAVSSGSGISVGTGSGGVSDSWYAQVVEKRISDGWIRPPDGIRVDATYSFYVNANGEINNVKQENSSGNKQLDMNVERAIRAASPLSKPPREFQGKRIQFIARFVHPPEINAGN